MTATHAIERLEARLCDQLGRRHCIVAGRGATAIYLALRALPAKRGKVVLPSILCPSPASAALYAGLEPIFCDVSLSDFNM
ncbi:MAG TPA: DegT/DnrJ/EryC1/StrS family aminotransferase, partial [Chthoniobacteraceae bacterium]|nr:DegT/DnrJ/EryC1/StrS family aminotransferase [Chthoniobacteraceae bacterium]